MRERYRVEISDRALSDLRGIFDFIEANSPGNPEMVIARLLDAVDSLNALPARFKRVGVRRSSGAPVHWLVVRPFIVYYSIDSRSKLVTVMLILHGRQRQPTKFE